MEPDWRFSRQEVFDFPAADAEPTVILRAPCRVGVLRHCLCYTTQYTTRRFKRICCFTRQDASFRQVLGSDAWCVRGIAESTKARKHTMRSEVLSINFPIAAVESGYSRGLRLLVFVELEHRLNYGAAGFRLVREKTRENGWCFETHVSCRHREP